MNDLYLMIFLFILTSFQAFMCMPYFNKGIQVFLGIFLFSPFILFMMKDSKDYQFLFLACIGIILLYTLLLLFMFFSALEGEGEGEGKNKSLNKMHNSICTYRSKYLLFSFFSFITITYIFAFMLYFHNNFYIQEYHKPALHMTHYKEEERLPFIKEFRVSATTKNIMVNFNKEDRNEIFKTITKMTKDDFENIVITFKSISKEKHQLIAQNMNKMQLQILEEIRNDYKKKVIESIQWNMQYEYCNKCNNHVMVIFSGLKRMTLLDFIYFSTYTITTTGYGDIVPISPVSKLITIVENFYEVFFIVIFLSALMLPISSNKPQ